MGLDVPLRVRISRRMRDELASAGFSTSAATRAYLLLGMAAAGVDLGPFRGEVTALLGEELAPELLAALERCWAERSEVRASERSAEACIPAVSQVYSNAAPTLPVPEPAVQTAWDDAYEV
jgi:hypothetical protein